MKTTTYSGELPLNPFPQGDRVFAKITFDCDGEEPFTENTVVDVAIAHLNAYIRLHGLVHAFEFRVVTISQCRAWFASWVAGSFGHVVPVVPGNIKRLEHTLIEIAPTRPIDYRILVRTDVADDADKIMTMLLAKC